MWNWRNNSKLLIQGAHTMPICIDMLRLTYQRHAAYCVSHHFDYWPFIGNPCPDRQHGAWDKVHYINQALQAGYGFIVWVDTDAAIIADVDLTEALTEDQHIGACIHDANGIVAHYNVGVLYLRNTEETKSFVQKWHDSYPGEERWFEQGSFNQLAKDHPGIVSRIDDKWNSTINTNESPDPVVMAWHGIAPQNRRLAMMKNKFVNDYLKYRV